MIFLVDDRGKISVLDANTLHDLSPELREAALACWWFFSSAEAWAMAKAITAK